MIKRIAALLLVAFVFTGAWWDEKKGSTSTSTPAPSYNSYNTSSSEKSSAAAYQEPVKETYKKVSKKSKAAPAPAAPAAAPAGGPNSTAAALKVLSEGNPDERKARMESLVRLSNALRKQRELKEQQQQ